MISARLCEANPSSIDAVPDALTQLLLFNSLIAANLVSF